MPFKPGNKGGGRKGFYDEQMVKKIIGSANRIIYNTLEGKGKYADVPVEVLIEVATRFALKAIPQQVSMEGLNQVQVFQLIVPETEHKNRLSETVVEDQQLISA